MKKTKSDIVQRLLNKNLITAEEAVVLLSIPELELEKKPSVTIFPYMTNWPFLPTEPNPYKITGSKKDDIK